MKKNKIKKMLIDGVSANKIAKELDTSIRYVFHIKKCMIVEGEL